MTRNYQASLFTVAFALLSFHRSTLAGPMNQKEFSDLVSGNYQKLSPSFQASLNRSEGIRIYEQNGDLYLENKLYVNTKHLPALYKVTRFTCYTHLPQQTTCVFQAKVENMGAFVHFLGVTPNITVNRLTQKLQLEINPDFHRGERQVVRTLVEKQ